MTLHSHYLVSSSQIVISFQQNGGLRLLTIACIWSSLKYTSVVHNMVYKLLVPIFPDSVYLLMCL